jgi:c-di-GMP-binding flagellar brake protein YcgR
MAAMTDVERRKFFRIEVDAPIRFRLIEETSSKPLTDWINGSTVDVSLGGVKVTAPMPEAQVEMLVDQYVLIEFACRLPGTPRGIAATATVAYFLHGAAASKAPTITFGLSFVAIDDSAKDVIAAFIRTHINQCTI